MKGWQRLSKLILTLSLATGAGAFICLVLGAQDSVLGLGIWMGFAYIGLLVLGVGGIIVSNIQDGGGQDDDRIAER